MYRVPYPRPEIYVREREAEGAAPGEPEAQEPAREEPEAQEPAREEPEAQEPGQRPVRWEKRGLSHGRFR